MVGKLIVGQAATIASGACQGIKGELIRADWLLKEVVIRVDGVTIVKTAWDNVKQGDAVNGYKLYGGRK